MGTYINFSLYSYLEVWCLEVPHADAMQWEGSAKTFMFYAPRCEYFRGFLGSTWVSGHRKHPTCGLLEP